MYTTVNNHKIPKIFKNKHDKNKKIQLKYKFSKEIVQNSQVLGIFIM